MPKKILFLTTAQVERLHAQVIARFGGSTGLRDRGLFESACEMPRAMFGEAFLHPTLEAMAAAYLFHLCSNHPFMDGNKRVGLGAALVFIEVNGHTVRATDAELERLTLEVARGAMTKDAVTAFFKSRLKRLGSQRSTAAAKPAKPKRRKGEDRRG